MKDMLSNLNQDYYLLIKEILMINLGGLFGHHQKS